LPGKPTEDDFIAACRAELSSDIGELAAYVEPRFIDERLILPNKQSIQFEEQLAAVQALTKVHYSWGTARAWNESGITVLFAGPPGTGKTMAAEVMAQRLKLPMYRIDLSQVVNKYIGETEKNLKRLFDAADISDMVLFFDEADSLFGKRIEANDARDRYANLEISYLLERMERFKGLAILATNRKNDLDQAFLRRIRHIIDFPMPGQEQRTAIWQQVIPPSVAENSQIDIAFLAQQFPLAGGHIRSIVFNACLQSAHAGNGRQELFMKDVLIAVKREYDKMNRSLSLDQLGPYASHIAGLD
jgi:SpoVK/Ycf46/Vps4 family AAA+-type ATPase